MAKKPKITYSVERAFGEGNWLRPVVGATRDYANGYVDAMDDLYPSPALRIVNSEGKVVRQTLGHGKVHLN